MGLRRLVNMSQFNTMQVQYLSVDIVTLFSRTTDLARLKETFILTPQT